MGFYDEALKEVNNAVALYGTLYNLVKLPSGNENINQPWGSPDIALNDSSLILPVKALSVNVSGSTDKLGLTTEILNLLLKQELSLMVAPGVIEPEGLDNYDIVEKDGVTYKINVLERLRPADITLLYFIGASR